MRRKRSRKLRYVLYAVIAVGIFVALDIVLVKYYAPERKLNVIVISIDSFNVGHMGIYGSPRDTTPSIDTWAKDSVVFDDYISLSYLTPISEAAVQTGRYPFLNGVINFQAPLSGTVELLAEVLKRNGYQTVSIGSSPEFAWPILLSNFSRGFDEYNLRRGAARVPRTSSPPVDDALWWLQTQRKQSVPFYLWLHIGSVHWPYGKDAPEHFTDPNYDGFLKESAGTDGFPNPYGYMYAGLRYASSSPGKAIGTVSENDLEYVRDRYDDGILETDKALKELFDYLDESGLSSRTLVIFESEHGEGLGERGYVAHYDIYDEQVHVPLIMRIPGVAPLRAKGVASSVDIMPTILDALDIKSSIVDGVSWMPYLSRASSTPPRSAAFIARMPLWELVTRESYPLGESLLAADNEEHFYDTAIRTKEWKLIHRLAREAVQKYSWWGWLSGTPIVLPEYELYDLKNDPLERTNLYTQRALANDPTLIELKEQLNAWEREMKAALTPIQSPDKIQDYF